MSTTVYGNARTDGFDLFHPVNELIPALLWEIFLCQEVLAFAVLLAAFILVILRNSLDQIVLISMIRVSKIKLFENKGRTRMLRILPARLFFFSSVTPLRFCMSPTCLKFDAGQPQNGYEGTSGPLLRCIVCMILHTIELVFEFTNILSDITTFNEFIMRCGVVDSRQPVLIRLYHFGSLSGSASEQISADEREV